MIQFFVLVFVILKCISAHYLLPFSWPYLELKHLQTTVDAVNQALAAHRIVNSVLAYGRAIEKEEDRHMFPWESPENSSYYLAIEPAVNIKINFTLLDDSKDSFHLKTYNNKLFIEASSGVSAVWGFNYYLKKYCKSHVGWQVENIRWPTELPMVDEKVVANDRFRYYQNVCTYSYSFVWWKEREWAKHVAWMALNGINLALAPIGQEIIWRAVFTEVGMTENEIDEHFTGPAFLSWLRMGNIRGWGGPLTDEWHKRSKELQQFLIKRMTSIGMIPVLPAFAGHVPKAFARIYPRVSFKKMKRWNNFDEHNCCSLFIDPKEELFNDISTKFLTKVTQTYGAYHIYNSDPFNEVSISDWSTSFVQQVSKSIFDSMISVDDKAVWLLQNWMFIHDSNLWPMDRVRSFLTSVPIGRLLILDLQSEQWPQYEFYEMYYDQPFIWCMLHNFGGTLGMFGITESINKNVYYARNHINSTMVGTGLTPEGINQNYVVYDLMLESAWRQGPVDLKSWATEYAERRYGCGNQLDKAWQYLIGSVYNFRGLNRIRGKYVFVKKPSFKHKPWAWYKSHDLMQAWKQFILANCSSNAYLHDLTDITRQALQYRAEQVYLKMLRNLNNLWLYESAMNQFLSILRDMELVLKTNEDFSIISWLGRDFDNNAMNVINAKNQITLWGPNGEISDYANKQWAELFELYFIPRWKTFLEAYKMFLVNKEPFEEYLVQESIKETVEKNFVSSDIDLNRFDYPGIDNTIKEAVKKAFLKWYILPNELDLPLNVIWPEHLMGKQTTLLDVIEVETENPSVIIRRSTTTMG